MIADTFSQSLARLTGEEQKAVKTTAFDLQMNPANPGMQFHRIDKAKDKNFWSVRVNDDVRLIVHKTAGSFMLCYVDHHQKAYHWAERRKLETHPSTGAAQLVEIRERVVEIPIPKYVPGKDRSLPMPFFADTPDEELLSYGVPPEWLNDVKLANEDSLLELAEHLPAEAAEALLELATGGMPKSLAAAAKPVVRVAPPAREKGDPFKHPDALRRFRVMDNVEELKAALEFPWDRWTIFLHPAQRQMVEGNYKGPARVSGSAGTGKTIVALHRAVFLARNNPEARVLLTTFSETLANALWAKLRRLVSGEPRLGERVEVFAIEAIGRRLYEMHLGPARFVSRAELHKLIAKAAGEVIGHKFSRKFLLAEWDEVVDAWQLDSWEAYRDVRRLGRKTRLPEAQRAVLWSIFDRVRRELDGRGLITRAGMFTRLAEHLGKLKGSPFDYSVVDEAQDVSVAQLRFLAAMGAGRQNGLFLAGDLGQRIFQQPFSWKALGVDIRGRSRTLTINYRTSHQIRMQADQLLTIALSDVDGNTETRDTTISVFNGPPPEVLVLKSREEETSAVAKWMTRLGKEGLQPHEIGVIVRSEAELDRAREAVEAAKLPFKMLDEKVETTSGYVSVCTMHLAKGLEFRAVAVMACDDEIIPLQERIESVTDESDLEEVYNTERHLLYVACTRARDWLLVTSVSPESEFLGDLTFYSPDKL